MMWLTWRQFRTQTIVAAAGLVLIAIVLAVSGVQLADKFHASTAGCGAHHSCGHLASNFIQSLRGSGYQAVALAIVVLIYAVPGLIGVFWGAPLITREIETGTLRLAWTQSVTRTRWLAVKVGSIGLAAMAIAGVLSLLASWWINPVYEASAKVGTGDGVINRLWPIVFGVNGIAPIGYAAFGFALGLTFGVLIRRTLPAMAATLAVFAGIQVAWPQLIRPHLLTALRSIAPIVPAKLNQLMIDPSRHMYIKGIFNQPGAWVLSNQTIDTAGHPFTGPATQACLTGGPQACNASIGRLHLRQLVTYQPSSRYWAFQWYETAIFVALALLLVWFCYWRVSRRRVT
jgi:ABC-type transport system involved in multi-copper enzyme maturation permease subunit